MTTWGAGGMTGGTCAVAAKGSGRGPSDGTVTSSSPRKPSKPVVGPGMSSSGAMASISIERGSSSSPSS
jgi:hypothetical protein